MNHIRLFVLSVWLVASFMIFPAMAKEASTGLEARDTWQAAQVLVRSSMKLEVADKAKNTAKTFWLFVERTPNGRMRILVKDTPEGATKMTFLVHDKVCLVMVGEEVFQPATPWMLGYYLFDQSLDPAMLLSWALGLPGKDFSIDARLASVDLDKGGLTRLEQAGWRVDYKGWREAGTNRPALPAQFMLTGDNVSVRVSVGDVDAYTVVPDGYSEFKIM